MAIGTLVLLRHGQSTWNQENLFTGWVDVPLSERGAEEARHGGRLLADAGLRIDVVHTSVLLRAIQTAELALAELGRSWLPVRRHWRLNERHYGALQGLDKKATAERYGSEQVHEWRRSYAVPPPPVERGTEHDPSGDERYQDLPVDVLPLGECLKDVVERMLPYWHDAVIPDLRAGGNVLLAAHGNSLRALVKHLDGIPDNVIPDLNIATGIPVVYRLDPADPCRPAEGRGAVPFDERYLDPTAGSAAAEAVKRQAG